MNDVAKCEGIKHYDPDWGSWIDDHCFDCKRRSFPSGKWQVATSVIDLIWMSPWQGSGKCVYKIHKTRDETELG